MNWYLQKHLFGQYPTTWLIEQSELGRELHIDGSTVNVPVAVLQLAPENAAEEQTQEHVPLKMWHINTIKIVKEIR